MEGQRDVEYDSIVDQYLDVSDEEDAAYIVADELIEVGFAWLAPSAEAAGSSRNVGTASARYHVPARGT